MSSHNKSGLPKQRKIKANRDLKMSFWLLKYLNDMQLLKENTELRKRVHELEKALAASTLMLNDLPSHSHQAVVDQIHANTALLVPKQ